MAAYWQQYKLNFDPFMADQANDEPFLSARFEQQLDLLVHLSATEPKIQLVTGLTGIGKSTMMRLFLKQVANSAGICKVHGGATITPDILQDLLVRHLGFTLDESRPGQFKQSLTAKLKQMHENEQHFYLLIDNAHKLPKASLSFLLELAKIQASGDRAIHIILFGGPQLEAIIAELTSSFMGEQLTHTIRLEPFTNEEVREYILNRLHIAGWTKDNPFRPEELEKIIQASHGVASKINYFAKQILQQKMQGGNGKARIKRPPSAFPFKTVISGVILLGIVLVAARVYTHFSSEPTTMPSAPSVESAPSVTPEDIATAPAVVSAPEPKVAVAPKPAVKSIAEMEKQSVEPEPTITTTSVEPVQAPAILETPDRTTGMFSAHPKAVTTTEPSQATPAAPAKVEPVKVESVKVEPIKVEPAKVEPVTVEQPVQTQTTAEKPISNIETIESKQLHEVPQTAMTATPTTVSPKVKAAASAKATKGTNVTSTHSKDEQKILATNPHSYALQLAGATSLGNLQRSFSKTALAGKVLYFHTLLNGKDWYVAVYGQYPSAGAAENAIPKLPEALQANNPWPRSYGNMQAAIRLK